MISPKREWRKFETIEEKLEVLRELKLVSSKASEVKTLYYSRL